MAISSVSAASNAASAAYARPKPIDGKANAEAKEDETDKVEKTDKAEKTDESSDSSGGGLQAVHSVVAGALGLDDPKAEKPPEEEKNGYYTAGKWLAAAGTIGTILSVLA